MMGWSGTVSWPCAVTEEIIIMNEIKLNYIIDSVRKFLGN